MSTRNLLSISAYFKNVQNMQQGTLLMMGVVMVMFMISSVVVLKLLDSKYSAKKTNMLIFIYLVFMAIVNAGMMIYSIGRAEIFSQYTIVTFALFLFCMSLIISSWNFSKTCFGALVGISIIAVIMEVAMIPLDVVPSIYWQSVWMMVIFTVLILLLSWFLNKIFKPSFIYTFRELPKRWGWYSIIPTAHIVIHCLYFLKTINRDWRVYLIMSCVNLLLVFSYSLLFFNITRFRKVERDRMNSKIYQSQVEMMAGQIKASSEADNSLKIMRHDLKHYIATLKTFFDQGDFQKAKEYIGYVDENVSAIQRERFCENIVINACVGYYVKTARESDIDVEYFLNIPNDASGNDFELSTVFANALENAINACIEIKDENNRKIKITAQTKKEKIMIEVSNSCGHTVNFDEEGVPISKEGVGIVSILSYANANNSNVHFSLKNQIFTFRMVVDI